MNIDDLLFAPIGMADEDKEFLWEIMVTALGSTFDPNTMSDLRNRLFDELNEVGRVDIQNKSDIRALLVELNEIHQSSRS